MTKSTADVPESIKPHLMQIAERLWNSRAVVMVGAGFSKNASNAYPSWMQLGDVLYEKAHGKKPEPADKAYLSLLKVAEDVEAVIKRPALDALLMQHIPNDTVDPSTLHETLLKLPWADILTTNYDTLLERAQRKVVNRRYSTVLDFNDLAYAEKPRIIKLHGSFPSHRPFVITEEDYRQYPQARAPFVNTVRQALLENTLCLVGFSGDDPNFLHWIGWIRDQLGTENTQPIYLITIGSFSVAQQAVLAKRHIIVVDMALCSDVTFGDHMSALNKFFSFMEKEDPYRLDWPRADYSSPKHSKLSLKELEERVSVWQRQRQLYPGWVILSHTKRDSLLRSIRPWMTTTFTDEVKAVTNGIDIMFLFELCWSMEKCLLPLHDDVEAVVESILDKYWPFFETDDSIYREVKRENEQFGHLDWPVIQEAWLGLAFSLLRFYREEDRKNKWQQIRKLLNGLNHYLTDEQKEFLQYQNYLFYLFQLDISKARDALINWRPGPSKPFWQNIRFTAAAELGLLQQLNINGTDIGLEEGLLQSLLDIRIQGQYRQRTSFYQAESHEAYQMLFSKWIPEALSGWDEPQATANEEIQVKSEFFKSWQTGDIARISHQSRFQVLNENITNSEPEIFSNVEDDWRDLFKKKADVRKLEWNALLRDIRSETRKLSAKLFNKRWDELKAVGCDPWAELKFFELMLAKPAEKQNSFVEHASFDLGRKNTSQNLGSDDTEALSAYAFLRFAEDIGLPFSVVNTTFVKSTVVNALPRIANFFPAWAILSLLRSGESTVIDRLFSREDVFSFSADRCDELIKQFLEVLTETGVRLSTELRKRNTFEQRLAILLPELISRLCCKSSFATKKQVFEFVVSIYKSPKKTSYGGVLNLTRRLFNSLSGPELIQLLPDIVIVRRPTDLNGRTKRDFPPLLQLVELSYEQIQLPKLAVLQAEIDIQLRNLTSSDDKLRDWAIATLIPLQQLGILNPEQAVQLNAGCWCFRNEYGLPKNNVFYQFTFLKYLPRDGEKDRLFKEFIDQSAFPVQPAGEGSIIITGGFSDIVHEIIGAAQDDTFWTTEDARKLLIRLIQWWDADKHRLEKERSTKSKMTDIWGGSREFHARLQQISELLAEVVGPVMKGRTAVKTKKELSRVLAEMRQEQLQTLEAQVACLHLISMSTASLLEQIVTALQSGKASNENDALKAILLIVQKQHTELWSQAEDLLVQFILWNRSKNLTQGLWVVIRLLKKNHTNLSPQLKLAALKRLQRLILETDYKDGSLAIDFNHKIELRKVAMRLASAFAPYMQELDSALAGTIEKWRQISTSPEEFAEVKHAWTD